MFDEIEDDVGQQEILVEGRPEIRPPIVAGHVRPSAEFLQYPTGNAHRTVGHRKTERLRSAALFEGISGLLFHQFGPTLRPSQFVRKRWLYILGLDEDHVEVKRGHGV